jgi:hypothetical protein
MAHQPPTTGDGTDNANLFDHNAVLGPYPSLLQPLTAISSSSVRNAVEAQALLQSVRWNPEGGSSGMPTNSDERQRWVDFIVGALRDLRFVPDAIINTDCLRRFTSHAEGAWSVGEMTAVAHSVIVSSVYPQKLWTFRI